MSDMEAILRRVKRCPVEFVGRIYLHERDGSEVLEDTDVWENTLDTLEAVAVLVEYGSDYVN